MTGSFTSKFAQAWAEPTAEGLAALLSEDVVLRQPHLPPIRGKTAVVAEFSRLLRWIPGTRSVVTNSMESPDAAFIEHELQFPVGEKVVRLPAVDRFVLKDGLGVERVVYFDQVSLVLSVLRHPSLWGGYIKYRFGA